MKFPLRKPPFWLNGVTELHLILKGVLDLLFPSAMAAQFSTLEHHVQQVVSKIPTQEFEPCGFY